MGEKRAYKPRKPGGGRKKLKPEYDAGKNLKEQMDAAVALYNSEMSLQAIGDELSLNPIKVRKLLITAGVYESEVAEKVQDTFEEYRETQNYKEAILLTANILQLSKASVTSYLPYKKGVYFPSAANKEKISVGAERQRRYGPKVIRLDSGEGVPVQSIVDGAKYTAFIDEAVMFVAQEMEDGRITEKLKSIDGKHMIKSASVEFMSFIEEAYKCLRWEKK